LYNTKLTITLKDIQGLGSIEFWAKKVVEGFITGLHKSPFHGFSVEFAEHRQYNTGESTKNIDWKVLAKTDRLFVKRFEEETNLRCFILNDVSASMCYPIPGYNKLRFSVLASAAIAMLLQRQRDAFGVCIFDDQIRYTSAIKSTKSHLNSILHEYNTYFEQRSTAASTQIAKVLHAMALQIPRRSMVILFSDLFDSTNQIEPMLEALQHLKHGGHDIIVFHVFDGSTEKAFNFESRPYEFVDAESQEKIRLNPKELQEVYTQSYEAHMQKLAYLCGQYKIDFVEADAQLGFDQVLLPFIMKRSRLG
jgi:uncharacterized protein (DUF58 family)